MTEKITYKPITSLHINDCRSMLKLGNWFYSNPTEQRIPAERQNMT